MKDLLLRAHVVVRTSNMKISRCRLADYVKTLHQKACRTCSTIIFLHSSNQIIDLLRCRWRCRRKILNSLMTTGKATTTPQINELIAWMRKNNRAARAARTYEQERAVLCKATTWNYHIYCYDEHLSIVLCIYFDSAQTNPVAWFFGNILKCEQDGIIAK